MEDLGDPPTTARWLAWATAVLLIIGVVSAGVMNISSGSEDGVVTAAARSAGQVELPSTTTPPPAPPVPPSNVQRPAATSTTVPKAAAAVLKALGSTAPPTTQPPTTTSTTTAPTTTTSSTTTTTVPSRATVSVRNELTRPFLVKVNDVPVTVDPGQQSAGLPLELRQTTDAIEGDAMGEPPCEVGMLGDLFRPGLTYLVSVVASETACAELRVTQVN